MLQWILVSTLDTLVQGLMLARTDWTGDEMNLEGRHKGMQAKWIANWMSMEME